jgi:hypothetical protein
MLYFAGTDEYLDTKWDRDTVVFNLGGGRHWTRWQRPPGGPPSMSSSTSTVETTGPTDSAPQDAHHRCLQYQWWMLPNPPAAPPRGQAIDIFFNLSGGRYWTHRQRSLGGHHHCRLQPWWWTLSDLPTAPPRGPAIDVVFNIGGGHYQTRRQRLPGGPPSMSSSTSVVDTVGPTGSTPRGAAGGRRCRTHWQRPQGPDNDVYFNRHRRLATSGIRYQYLQPTPPRGPLVNYHYLACYKQGIS